jgi:hypothetical protein
MRDIYHQRDSITCGAHDINSEGHVRSVSFYDINEQWRLIKHTDIVVGTDDSKKSMSDPTIMRSNSFKDDDRMFDVPYVNLSCQSTGQLCHCQCIQSMLHNILENPRSSALASKH